MGIPRIRFTWNISYDCNYRCSYCFYADKWDKHKYKTLYLSVSEWMRFWSSIYDKYKNVFLIITGGEPFIYPNFIEIIDKLSQLGFSINITTNASTNLEMFVSRIDSEKVSLSLSFHKEFETLECFIKKVKFIRSHNFQGCLNLVAYPPFLQEFKYFKDRLLEDTGENFKVVAFFGKYNNREYPNSYTEEEKSLIGLTDKWFSRINRKDMLCNAGYDSALLRPDGKVVRCGQVDERFVVGNFTDPDFKLYDKPLICDVDYCPCAEYSTTGKEDAIE